MKHVSLLAVAVALVLTACAGSNRSRLDPAEFRGRTVIEPSSSVPLFDMDDDQVGTAEIASSGAFRTQLGRTRNVPVVHVRLTIRNADLGTFRVPLDQLKLEGTWAEPLRPAAIFCPGRDAYATSVEIPAGESREVDIVFVLPSDGDLDRMPGFFLSWGVDLPTEVVRERTAFKPAGDRPGTNMARAFRPVDTF